MGISSFYLLVTMCVGMTAGAFLLVIFQTIPIFCHMACSCRKALSLFLFMEEMTCCLTVHIIMGRAVEKYLFLKMQDLICFLYCISQIMGYHDNSYFIFPVQLTDHGIKVLDRHWVQTCNRFIQNKKFPGSAKGIAEP